MINYYRAGSGGANRQVVSNMEMLVLQFHGMLDTAVDKDGLIRTWEWIDADYTLVTLPDVGHWGQQDGAGVFTTTMRW